MPKINSTNSFERDYVVCFKKHRDVTLLDEIIILLEKNGTLPAKYKPHKLKGKWSGHSECHVDADWLLIYYFKSKNEITLVRTGSHDELFKKQ